MFSTSNTKTSAMAANPSTTTMLDRSAHGDIPTFDSMGYSAMKRSFSGASASLQKQILDVLLESEVRLWSVVLGISFLWQGLLMALSVVINDRLPLRYTTDTPRVVDWTVLGIAIASLCIWVLSVGTLIFLVSSVSEGCLCCASSAGRSGKAIEHGPHVPLMSSMEKVQGEPSSERAAYAGM